MKAWATVTDNSPLTIQFDGDDVPLPYAPDSLVHVRTGDRVWCDIEGKRVVILGVGTPHPPIAPNGSTAPGPSTGLQDAGAVLNSGWSFGTNYVMKQGYMAHVYFNLTSVNAISSSATGDIGNMTVGTLPASLKPVINAPIMHALNGRITQLVFGDNGASPGTILLAALAPDQGWEAGGTRSFGGTYMTRTWEWE